MGLDDFLISTGVDQLIRLVKEKGRIEMSAAGAELRQPAKTIEDWAHVLEEEGLVAIEYKLTKIYLVWKAPTKEYVEKKSEKLAAKTVSAKADIDRLLVKVQSEGKQLASMQQEIASMQSKPLSKEDLAALQAEISKIEEEFNGKMKAGSDKLAKLRKKAEEASEKASTSTAGMDKKQAAATELRRELAVLKRFEETLTSQQQESDASFAKLENDIAQLQSQAEAEDPTEAVAQLKAELEEAMALKKELLGAIEAVTDEVSALDSKMTDLQSRLGALSKGSGSVAAAKKKIAEMRALTDEARRQRTAVKERLDDSLELVKKQTARIEEVLGKVGEPATPDQMKSEYIEIETALSDANDELAARQKEVLAKLNSYRSGVVPGTAGKLSKEDIEKVSFLLRELSHEQAMLEEKVHALAKESDILKMEASPPMAGAAPGGMPVSVASSKLETNEHTALVEKIKISQDDEAAFERKREELRALIRKMWEENRGGG